MLIYAIRPSLSHVVVMENGNLLDLVVKLALENGNTENWRDSIVGE